MSKIILRGVPVDLDSAVGYAFVCDAVRSAEGLIDDAQLMETHELTAEDLRTLAANKTFARAVQAERNRRVRTGLAARESASGYFIKAPKVLDSIMMDEQANARHRIEAVRELRQTAIGSGDAERPMDTERFVIRIDLTAGGGEVHHYDFDKPTKIETNDTPPEQPKLVGSERPKLVIDNEKSDE
jgi:hypothetical protein